MGKTIHLTLVLGLVSALAAGVLAVSYDMTKDRIAAQEATARVEALEAVFFRMETRPFVKAFETAPVQGVWTSEEAQQRGEAPDYYVAEGEGLGYNTGVPIRLLVGFTNPHKPAAALLEGYVPEGAAWGPAGDAKGLYVVGWRVIRSEETPGLGEKAKEAKADATWAQILTGEKGSDSLDTRTDFQAQFAGRQATPAALKLRPEGGEIDIITAATYSTRGLVGAIVDAARKVDTVARPGGLVAGQ